MEKNAFFFLGFKSGMNLSWIFFLVSESVEGLRWEGQRWWKIMIFFRGFFAERDGCVCDDYVELFFSLLVISYPNDQAWIYAITRGLSILGEYHKSIH